MSAYHETKRVLRVPLDPRRVVAEEVSAPEGVLRIVCPSCSANIIALRPGTTREGFSDATERLMCQACGQLLELEEPEPEEETD